MEKILELLNKTNNEGELFEKLLSQTLAGQDREALITASRIQAGRDLRFDLSKVIKENG